MHHAAVEQAEAASRDQVLDNPPVWKRSGLRLGATSAIERSSWRHRAPNSTHRSSIHGTGHTTSTHNSGLMNFLAASTRAIGYVLKRVDEQSKKCQQQKSTESNSPLLVMAVISLILACRWTCTQVRELSINISYRRRPFHRDTQHEYSSVPQHASLSRSHAQTPKQKNNLSPGHYQPHHWLTFHQRTNVVS